MTITVNSPNGVSIQFPDGTDQETIRSVMGRASGQQPKAEPKPQTDAVVDATGQLVRGVNRGINSIVSLPGEAVGMAADALGFDGNKFRWNNPVSRFMESADVKPQTAAGRYADATGRAIGASAAPTGALLANSARMAALAPTTAPRAIGQMIGQSVQRSPGAFVAADVAGATGSAFGSQTAQEAGAGPVTQMVAGVAGAMAPAAIGYGVSRALQPVQRARANVGEAGAYGSIADDLGMPIDDYAANIARGTGAGGRTASNNQRALDILGEEMVAARGNVQIAQQAAVARLSRDLGVTPQTATQQIRTLSGMYDDSPLMFSEYPGVASANDALRGPAGGLRRPQNVDLDALNRAETSNPQQTMDYLANNGNAQSAINTRNAISARQDELAPAMRQVLEGAGPQIGNRPANITDAEQMIEGARRVASAEYRAAYAGPINNNAALALPQLLTWYERQMFGRSGEAAQAMNRAINEFLIQGPNGPTAMMSLQHLQDARGAVRGMIREARQGGREHIVTALQPFYNRVSRMMEAMSPQWASANRQWADMNFERIAQELGEAFAQKAGPRYREQIREFNQLNPRAQDIVRIHWVQQQLDKLDNLGDAHSVSKLFTTDHARNTIRALFGDRATVEFTRAVRDISVAQRTQNMMGNSKTHMRGVAQKQKDAETGLVAASRNMSVNGVKGWLLERATQLLTEAKNRPMSRILTTPMSDTASVAMHLQRMRQQQQRLNQINAPRQMRQPVNALGAGMFAQDEEGGAR